MFPETSRQVCKLRGEHCSVYKDEDGRNVSSPTGVVEGETKFTLRVFTTTRKQNGQMPQWILTVESCTGYIKGCISKVDL